MKNILINVMSWMLNVSVENSISMMELTKNMLMATSPMALCSRRLRRYRMSICARMAGSSSAEALLMAEVKARIRSILRPRRLLMDKSTNPSPEIKIHGAMDACILWIRFSVGISFVYNVKVLDCQ